MDESLPASEVVLTTMAILEDADGRECVAHLFGTVYELALRLGVSPRTILDSAFVAIASNERWEELEAELRERLGRL